MTTTATSQLAIITSAQDLGDRLHDAALFASTEGARPGIASVLIEHDEDGTRFVATDSYQLVVVPVTSVDGPHGSWLVSREDVLRIVKVCRDAKRGDVTMLVGDDGVTIAAAGIELGVTLVDCEYPNYRNIFPGDDVPIGQDTTMGWGRALMGRFAKLRTPHKDAALVFEPHGLKPASWRIGDIYGLWMPCRLG